MSNILISEDWINKTNGWTVGSSGIYETFTDDKGQLYKSLVKEYGRCTGKVYIDKDDTTLTIGWVFEKRVKYDDCNETYLQETWITLHEARPVTHTEYEYLTI